MPTSTCAGGLSKPRLGRMHDVMAGHVAGGDMPGLVTLVSRGGEVHVDVIGNMAIGGAPMQRDTIFRISSMTKPVTAAAAMILVEECKLRLDDPVDPWLPELADRKVLRAVDARLDDTVPARRAITLRDLLTFRLGLGMLAVFPDRYPIQKAVAEAGFAPGPVFPSFAPDELMRRYGSLPLLYQPGERWLYNSGTEILGVLIARVAGTSFADFLAERIFAPLGMRDTAFFVPGEELGRLATAYQRDDTTGDLKVFDDPAAGKYAAPPVFENGSAGLVSTADDFNAFAQMMLNGGRLGSERILSRPTVELMTTDHIAPEQKQGSELFFGGVRGWGFGLSVFTKRDDLAGRPGRPGRYGWDGGYGTSWYSDPGEGLTGILLTQRMMDSPQPPRAMVDFWTLAYQAIDD
ncbi:beta-lactamase family protein [Bradyrhizobium sp. KBS0727]|uniref:serine hydrolase domain-containing protein n=1 Tax=unclassified Bradyrhizobium TaxID=2631580 RepID=UPI00110E2554|nr:MULTISPECIES: serine hydrolase domain-containing protein [unclassified Bradyrhizobium]QDW40931.1 beta-lactamase family protein [Bradyrhizobium sp. KBS0725]QDW47537.1 beta-lactamase family protein [Bradyrhizobium sp. KBS0727]